MSEISDAAALEVTKIFLVDIGADLVTKLFDYIEDLIYQKIIGLMGEFFSTMNSMGSDLFGLPWVNQIVTLFSMLGWALFVVGIIVALFDFAIESQNGRGDPKALALNIIKGFMAVNLFSVVPVKLYGFAVAMQSSSFTSVPFSDKFGRFSRWFRNGSMTGTGAVRGYDYDAG